MSSLLNRVKSALKILFGLSNRKNIFFTKDFYINKKYKIGDYTYGNPQVIFENKNANLIIGKYCSISSGVTIFLGGNHRYDWVTTYPFNDLPNYYPEARNIIGHPATKGNVEIGNDVWIGRNVTILSGVKIMDGAVIAAESVVTKDVGPYEIWGGNPARFIKKRFSDELINQLVLIKWWNWEHSKVIKNVELLQSNNIEYFIKHNNE